MGDYCPRIGRGMVIMPRQKGTPNTPQTIIDEIVRRHHEGETLRLLTAEYGKPFKTIRNM